MGLQITELVPKKEISFKDLYNKKIAIDSSQMIYQFLSSIRQQDGTPLMDSKQRITSHLQGIITRITNLMSQGIKLCFVFDGKPPLLKVKEQEEREYRKQMAEEKFREAKELGDEESMLKYSKQSIRLSREMSEESKELIQALGLPAIQAPSEAEAQCAFMNEQGDVDYVGSSDFVVFLVGTDFNYGVPRVGPKTALRLVRQHKNFDTLFKEAKADFNWKEIYAVFKNMPIIKNFRLKFTNQDVDKIMKILVDKHEFNHERVQKNIDRIINVKKASEQGSLTKFF